MTEKGKLLDKVKYIIGLDDLEEDYDEQYEDENTSSTMIKNNNKRSKKILNIHTNSNIKLAIHEPLKFEDSTKIVDDMKNRKPVVLNIQRLDIELKKKVFDFVNGAVYALEGNVQKVAKDIFILAPKNVDIDGNIKNELEEKGLFPWKK